MLSIIVPVLNEAPQIRPFLRHLRGRAPQAEIIVIDGGSRDATVALATGYCDRLLCVGRGRPGQMNAGVQAASGDMLWFVHVDCEVPLGADEAIARTLSNGYAGGCFRVRISDPRPVYRIHDSWAHWIGRVLRARCGDHGIFCSRQAFTALGGYREMPLMEDIDLVRRLHTAGKFAWLPDRLLLSKRRHEQIGPYRYTFICSAMVALYCAGVGSEALARIYGWLVATRDGAARPLPPVEWPLFAEFRQDLP